MAKKSTLKKEIVFHVGMEKSVLNLLELLDQHYPYFVEAKDIDLGRNTTHIVVQAYMDELIERLEPDVSKEIRDPKTDYEKLKKTRRIQDNDKGIPAALPNTQQGRDSGFQPLV